MPPLRRSRRPIGSIALPPENPSCSPSSNTRPTWAFALRQPRFRRRLPVQAVLLAGGSLRQLAGQNAAADFRPYLHVCIHSSCLALGKGEIAAPPRFSSPISLHSCALHFSTGRATPPRAALFDRRSHSSTADLSDNPEKRLEMALPSGWLWVRVRDVAEARLGKMLDKAKNRGRQYPYLRNTNVHWFEVRTDELKTMPLGDDEVDSFLLHVGDVLICGGGHGIARTAVWRGESSGVAFQKALHRVRPGTSLNGDFLRSASTSTSTPTSSSVHLQASESRTSRARPYRSWSSRSHPFPSSGESWQRWTN